MSIHTIDFPEVKCTVEGCCDPVYEYVTRRSIPEESLVLLNSSLMERPKYNVDTKMLVIPFVLTEEIQTWNFFLYFKNYDDSGFSQNYIVDIVYNCRFDSLQWIDIFGNEINIPKLPAGVEYHVEKAARLEAVF